MKRFAILLWAASLAISVPLVLGFFGAAHPAFDAMAHFRAHLAVLLALAAICLLAVRGQRVVGAGLARDILDAWLGARFEGGRHQRRVDKITALEAQGEGG